MSQQFAIPAVGSKVRITVRTKEIFIFSPTAWRDTVYEGTVVPSEKWVPSTSFCMTGDEFHRIREVPINLVTNIEMADGTAAATTVIDSQIKTLVVNGSKPGVTYTVTKVGNTVRCSCPGFQFRKACRHTAMI